MTCISLAVLFVFEVFIAAAAAAAAAAVLGCRRLVVVVGGSNWECSAQDLH
jgi:hypothetical protein